MLQFWPLVSMLPGSKRWLLPGVINLRVYLTSSIPLCYKSGSSVHSLFLLYWFSSPFVESPLHANFDHFLLSAPALLLLFVYFFEQPLMLFRWSASYPGGKTSKLASIGGVLVSQEWWQWQIITSSVPATAQVCVFGMCFKLPRVQAKFIIQLVKYPTSWY